MPERERQVLNLDALAVIRDAVSIGGREYEIKAASDLSPNDLAYLVKLSEEAQGVQDQDFNEEGVEKMMRNLRQQVRLIFYSDVPDDIIDGLGFGQMNELADFFIERAELGSRAMRRRTQANQRRSKISTGAT